MNRNRLYFYVVFAVFQTVIFVFTVWLDTASLDSLLGLMKYLHSFKYAGFFGFALLIADFIWSWIDRRANKKQDEILRHENNELKAKVYDYQEGIKNAEASKKI